MSDSESPPSDFGSPPSDFGSPPSDFGSPPSDFGSPPSDSGSPPSDFGSPPSDSGSPPSDSGSPPLPPSGSPPPESSCSAYTVIANETSFFNWLKTDRTCPTNTDVYAAIQAGGSSSTGSTEVAQTTQEIKSLKKQLDKRTTDVDVARDRASMTKRPEMTASYYDGWFPLNRPLKTSSIPVLIGISTMLLVSAFLILLEFFGLQTRITYFYYNFTTPSNNKPFWTMTGFAFVLLCLVLYLYFR